MRWLLCLAGLCAAVTGAFALTAGANHIQTELISTGPNGGNGPTEAEWGGVSSDGTHVYFTHAFAAPVTGECTATTSHGEPFAAVVEGARVFGVQFHPEKSSEAGLRVLQNFVRLVQT